MSAILKGDPLTTDQIVAQAGQEVVNGKAKMQYLYVPANTEKGEVLMIAYDGDEETNPKAVAVATTAFPVRLAVATEDQGSTAGFQWCVTEGECQALVDGTTDVAKDDFLEVINADDSFTKDGTARTTVSGAIARVAVTANANTLADVYVIGEQHTIAAS
jgi:hypothetical protein